jgi:hypothetical protein
LATVGTAILELKRGRCSTRRAKCSFGRLSLGGFTTGRGDVERAEGG